MEIDLIALSRWVHETESFMHSRKIETNWTAAEIKEKLSDIRVYNKLKLGNSSLLKSINVYNKLFN